MNVVLSAIAAKNVHKTLAPWYLKSIIDITMPGTNVIVMDSNINEQAFDIANDILSASPGVVGFSCYIWNINIVMSVCAIIKAASPECKIILGGPEVWFETDINQFPHVDFITSGPGDTAFGAFVMSVQKKEAIPRAIGKSPFNICFDLLLSPFTDAYFDSFKGDKKLPIENMLIYYESSRGCPFDCSYCLSSAIKNVDELQLERVFKELTLLISKGAKCIKFVDRTFNANKKRAYAILEFIHALDTDCTFHFEVAADLFDAPTLALIEKMPPERVQFEIGIQSVNPKTLAKIDRKTNIESALANIQKLVGFNNCHIHVDLIAGLPYETLESFKQGINRVIEARPQMLQLGFLKMLKGTTIRNRAEKLGYQYSPIAPYEVLSTKSMSTEDLRHLKKVEAVIERFYNTGIYAHTVHYATQNMFHDAYSFFDALARYCEHKNLRIAPKAAYTLLYEFLCSETKKQKPLQATHVADLLRKQESDAENTEALPPHHDAITHHIKLDCFTYNASNVLPDAIDYHRDKEAERNFCRSSAEGYKNIRIEYFSFDDATRTFIYDVKDPISGAFKVLF